MIEPLINPVGDGTIGEERGVYTFNALNQV